MDRRDLLKLVGIGVIPGVRGAVTKEQSDGSVWVLYYPYTLLVAAPDGSPIPAKDIANQIIENIQPGSRVCIPHMNDGHGLRMWELQRFETR